MQREIEFWVGHTIPPDTKLVYTTCKIKPGMISLTQVCKLLNQGRDLEIKLNECIINSITENGIRGVLILSKGGNHKLFPNDQRTDLSSIILEYKN
jgi:hypothetical protein